MGCGPSRAQVAHDGTLDLDPEEAGVDDEVVMDEVSVTTPTVASIDDDEDLNDFIALIRTNYFFDNPADPVLNLLKTRIHRQLTTFYPRPLIEYLGSIRKVELVITALDLLEATPLLYDQNLNVLVMFSKLKASHPDIFSRLLRELSALCNERGLRLEPSDIDMVLYSLRQQDILPPSALEYFNDFFAQKRLSLDHLKDNLIQLRAEEEVIQSRRDMFKCFKQPLEVRARVLHAMRYVFGVTRLLSLSEHFFLEILGFLAEHVQASTRAPHREHDRAELTSAVLLTGWLFNNVMFLHPTMQLYLEYIIERLVILGRVKIPCHHGMISLSELYFLFENAFKEAGLLIIDPSNVEFIHRVNSSMILMDVSATYPTALHCVVSHQARDPILKTMPLIHKFSRTTLLLQFCQSSSFRSYVREETFDQQAFLTMLICCINHCSEICSSGSDRALSNSAQVFKSFVLDSRNYLTNPRKRKSFQTTFYERAIFSNLGKICHDFFFTALPEEINVILSQLPALQFARASLLELVPSTKCLEPALINLMVIETDADNLRAFLAYYVSLDEFEKCELCYEICITLIVQAEAFELTYPSFRSPDQITELQLVLETPCRHLVGSDSIGFFKEASVEVTVACEEDLVRKFVSVA